jgi:hypothetical protein
MLYRCLFPDRYLETGLFAPIYSFNLLFYEMDTFLHNCSLNTLNSLKIVPFVLLRHAARSISLIIRSYMLHPSSELRLLVV